MNQTEKVAFLNKYTLSANKTVELIVDKNAILEAPIPEYWKRAFVESDLEKRKSIIITEWEKYVAKELSNTIFYLKTYLTDVELMKIGEEYSILYTILSYKTKKASFYEGKNSVSPEKFEGKFGIPASEVDSSIVNFYTKIHDGFYYYPSKTMGLDSMMNIDCLDEFEWEYEDQLDMDLRTCYNFFSNGMGMYVVLDLTQRLDTGTYLWSTRELPKGNLNFWDLIDEWIVIGLDF